MSTSTSQIVNLIPVDPNSGLSGDTSAAANKQNYDATNSAWVAFENPQLAANYQSHYNDWAANLTSGGFVPPERRTPPPVPNSWVVVVNAAPLLNDRAQTGPSVFTLPNPLPTYNGGLVKIILPANHIHVGPETSAKGWFQAMDDDTVPSGQTVLNVEDMHSYLKWGTPFRNQGIYQQVG